MTITDETIQVDRTPSNKSRQTPRRRLLGTGAPIVIAAVAFLAVVERSGATTSEPASRSRNDIVRDLVARGVVPAATLDDGTQPFVKVAGLIVSANALDAVCGVPAESCAWIVKFAVPAVVGVPLIAPVPAFNVSPAGSAPAVILHV